MYLLKPVQGGFEVRAPGPLTYHFGSDGVLGKIVHKTGTTVSLSHENRWNGLVSAVTNGVGLVAEHQHDIMDRPTNIVWRAPGGA